MKRQNNKPTPYTQRKEGPIYSRLKNRHRQERMHYDEAWAGRFGLRIHRALSWLNKAELSPDDLDTRFIALWIGFNAAYAGDIGGQIAGRATLREAESFQGFLNKICRLDENKKVQRTLRQLGTGALRNLLDSPYIFQPYWDQLNGQGGLDWESRFQKERHQAHAAWMGTSESQITLGILFERLYTLRNQLVHGGATWGSGQNRRQLQDACILLQALLPDMLEIMLDHPSQFDSPPFYPPSE